MLTKYAYLVFHAHSAIWKERNCKTSDGSSIKYCQEIMHILDAIKLSKEVTVIHCRGHQRGDSDITEGSRRDDQQAKGEATQSFNTQASFLWDKFPTDIKPQYSPKEHQHSLSCGDSLFLSGWLQTEDEKFVLPIAPNGKFLKLYIKLSLWKLKILTDLLRVLSREKD